MSKRTLESTFDPNNNSTTKAIQNWGINPSSQVVPIPQNTSMSEFLEKCDTLTTESSDFSIPGTKYYQYLLNKFLALLLALIQTNYNYATAKSEQAHIVGLLCFKLKQKITKSETGLNILGVHYKNFADLLSNFPPFSNCNYDTITRMAKSYAIFYLIR
jgi:hypothetical protein